MDPSLRSNGSNTRPAISAPNRAVGRSKAAGMTDLGLWIGDLLDDPKPPVREAAVRSLGQLGGRRAVELLMASSERIPVYRLAIALARAASDVDIEALMRQPASERAAVVTVLACGLRRDVLRVSPLLGIAHDRRWPKRVRVAACKALAAIGDRAGVGGLSRLAESDPEPVVKTAADRAHRRLGRRAGAEGRSPSGFVAATSRPPPPWPHPAPP